MINAGGLMNTVSLIKLDMALLDRFITSPKSAVVPYTIPSDLHPLLRDVAVRPSRSCLRSAIPMSGVREWQEARRSWQYQHRRHTD